MSYSVLRTDTANEQITEIVRYLSELSDGMGSALRFLDQLDEAAAMLASFPKSGAVPTWGTLARRGYRKLLMGHYVLLYKCDDSARQVTIHAVFYAQREYWKYL